MVDATNQGSNTALEAAEDSATPSSSGVVQATKRQQPDAVLSPAKAGAAASPAQQPQRPSGIVIHDLASILRSQATASTSAPSGPADNALHSSMSSAMQHKQARKQLEATLAAIMAPVAASSAAAAGSPSQQGAESSTSPAKLTPQQQLLLQQQLLPQQPALGMPRDQQQQQRQQEEEARRALITNPEHGFGDGPPGARRPPPKCRRTQAKQRRKEQQDGAEGGKQEAAGKLRKPREPPTDPVAEAFQHFRPLVAAELKAERFQVIERQRKWPLERLQREGLVLLGLTAKRGKELFGRPITILEIPDTELPWHRFTSGDIVRLTQLEPDGQWQGPPVMEANVLNSGRWNLRVVCEAWLPPGPWRVDMGAKALTYERMQAALEAMSMDPEHTDGRKREGPPGTPLRGLLLWPDSASAARPAVGLLPPAALQWAKRVETDAEWAKQEAARLGLNGSQIGAIAMSVQCKISLIQGPPGTGKTTTTVQLLRLLTREFGCPFPIMACAPSNVAVDNLLEGLVDVGVRALRVGQPVKVRESLRGQSVDAFIERHPLGLEVEETRAFARALNARLPHMRGKDKVIALKDVVVAQKVATELRAKMMADILDAVQVSFPFVVMDEGSQCCEPESLIPVVKGCKQVVLVGDQNQLPPVVMSDKAARGGLDISLFERLMASGAPSSLLSVQFYGGRLEDGVQPHERPPPDFPFPVPGRPIVLLDVADGVEMMANGGSKCNYKEAVVVADVVGHLISRGEVAGLLGVVSPYMSQVQLISRRLEPLMKHLAPLAHSQPHQGVWLDTDEEGGGSYSEHVLEVKSVDGYQGREKEIIVLSTVRANEEGKMGFLDDWRRLNVALTRARRALIIIGNARTLAATDPHWRAYITWLDEHSCIVTASDWARALVAGPVAAAEVVPEVVMPGGGMGRERRQRGGGKKKGGGGREAGWRMLEQMRQQQQQQQEQQEQQRPEPVPGVVISGL